MYYNKPFLLRASLSRSALYTYGISMEISGHTYGTTSITAVIEVVDAGDELGDVPGDCRPKSKWRRRLGVYVN